MAKLPNGDRAQIDLRKVTRYLLDRRHPGGGPKAAFFMSFGFEPENPQLLVEALLKHESANKVASFQKKEFSTSYIVEGPLNTATQRAGIVPAPPLAFLVRRARPRCARLLTAPIKQSLRNGFDM